MSGRTDIAFLKSFLARPGRVASPIPSGRRLARKIAEQVDLESEGLVLELGPGTGAVTQALCERGVAEQNLVLIESDPEFVKLLRVQFPRARVIEADAFAFADVLEGHDLRSIISGLPVLGQSSAHKRRFLKSAIEALASGRPFVQFSYSRSPPLPASDGVTVNRAATVWQNIWPMRIWVYRRAVTKTAERHRVT